MLIHMSVTGFPLMSRRIKDPSNCCASSSWMDPGLPGQMQQPSATPGQGTPTLPSPLSSLCPSFFFPLPPISFLFSPIPPSPPSFSQGSQPSDLRLATFSTTNLLLPCPPLLPPCPSCWSRSRVTAGGVATILSSFTHFLTLPPPLRNSPPCPGKDLWHRQQQQPLLTKLRC